MSVLVAYEVHRYNAGKWEIQAIFDEKELALSEARRLETGLRAMETRVVEETHDETSKRTRSKTVYETPKVRSEQPAAAAPSKPTPKKKKASKPRDDIEPRANRPRPEQKKASGPSFWVIGLTFVLLVGAGGAALYALQHLG